MEKEDNVKIGISRVQEPKAHIPVPPQTPVPETSGLSFPQQRQKKVSTFKDCSEDLIVITQKYPREANY